MTINNSGCACGMTVKALIKRFCRGMGARDTFGLPGMRERANFIGGKLVVSSEPEAGTEVELCIPADTAYALSCKTFLVIRIAQQKVEYMVPRQRWTNSVWQFWIPAGSRKSLLAGNCSRPAADVIRARRCRRLEAAGLPYEERPREFFAGARSCGEIMRLVRQRAR